MSTKQTTTTATEAAPAEVRLPFIRDEHLRFLDSLRESGATNMFGAGPYLVEAFGVDPKTSRTILGYWMRTFGRRVR